METKEMKWHLNKKNNWNQNNPLLFPDIKCSYQQIANNAACPEHLIDTIQLDTLYSIPYTHICLCVYAAEFVFFMCLVYLCVYETLV